MRRRAVLSAVVGLVLFGIWTCIVRVGISDGSRANVYIDRRFADWPQEISDIPGTASLQLSIYATYEADVAPDEEPRFFGRPTAGTAVDTFDSENINGSRFTTGAGAGAVSSMSAFVPGPIDDPPHDKFQMAVYEDSRGAPSRLLATTAIGELTAGRWNSAPIEAVLEPSTSYWLMYTTNGTNGGVNNITLTPLVSNSVDNAIGSLRTERLTNLANRVASLGDQLPMTLAIFVISVVAWRSRPRAGLALLAGFGVVLAVALALREVIFEPFGLYPSGHAVRTTYVAVAFCVVATWRGSKAIAAVFVAAVGIATLINLSHYSEEVIGGMLLAWSMATLAKVVADAPTLASHSEPATPGHDPALIVDISDSSLVRTREEPTGAARPD